MAGLRPDVPVPLGEHLHELRNRLIWPALVWGAVFIAAFAVQDTLKELFVLPLKQAVDIAGTQMAAKAGIVFPEGGSLRVLKTLSLGESMGVAMSLSMWAAFAVIIPLLIWQLYAFIAVGLTARERRLAFILAPLAVILFYAGTAFGYYLGMPYIYAWFIEWTARDPIAVFDLRLQSYYDDFILYTLVFGALFDIPWVIITVCRLGFITPDQLGQWRKVALMLATVVAALIGPGDPVVMLILMVPTYGLFELGLLAARLVGGPAPEKDVPHA